ncbi:MAG: hypothetical protein BWY13_01398 [Euryarchaeota archaeon ADurb.Bin190]|nr:MAG: hypothetical protein BWY13_01398 [Euryarchaeota archaeon ADurb.Bin190]
MIGRPDGLLIMLDHNEGISEVPELLEGLDKPGVVSLMQADGGLVQYIEHPGEVGADLGGQANPLGLASG